MQNDANLKGGEISIDWSLTNCFDFGGSYSTVIGQKSDDSYLPFMPADKIIGSIKYHLRKLSSLKNFYILVTLRNYLKQNKVAEEELPTPPDLGRGRQTQVEAAELKGGSAPPSPCAMGSHSQRLALACAPTRHARGGRALGVWASVPEFAPQRREAVGSGGIVSLARASDTSAPARRARRSGCLQWEWQRSR